MVHSHHFHSHIHIHIKYEEISKTLCDLPDKWQTDKLEEIFGNLAAKEFSLESVGTKPKLKAEILIYIHFIIEFYFHMITAW